MKLKIKLFRDVHTRTEHAMSQQQFDELVKALKAADAILKETTEEYVPTQQLIYKPEYMLLIAIARYLDYHT